MSLRRTLDVMGSTVERATSIPLSASCMVNRAELLSLVERARAELPVELDEAAALLVAHQEVIARAESDAEQLLRQARRQADAMVEESALVATARGRSEQILDAARAEAARLLRQADEYCDGRLAEFENDLDRARAQVRRGRDRLRERSDLHPADAGPVEPAEQESAEAYDQVDELEQVEAYEQVETYEEQAADGTDYEVEQYEVEYVAEYKVEYPAPSNEVAFDQVAHETTVIEEEQAEGQPVRELVHAQVGGPGERRVVDLAGLERDASEHSGLGQRVNLQ